MNQRQSGSADLSFRSSRSFQAKGKEKEVSWGMIFTPDQSLASICQRSPTVASLGAQLCHLKVAGLSP